MHGVTTLQLFNVKRHFSCKKGRSGDELCMTD